MDLLAKAHLMSAIRKKDRKCNFGCDILIHHTIILRSISYLFCDSFTCFIGKKPGSKIRLKRILLFQKHLQDIEKKNSHY